MSLIEAYLKTCGELSRFCSCNGWIDEDSLRYTVVMEVGNEIIVDVQFYEMLPDDPENRCGRIPCQGQLHLYTDRYGHVIRAEAL